MRILAVQQSCEHSSLPFTCTSSTLKSEPAKPYTSLPYLPFPPPSPSSTLSARLPRSSNYTSLPSPSCPRQQAVNSRQTPKLQNSPTILLNINKSHEWETVNQYRPCPQRAPLRAVRIFTEARPGGAPARQCRFQLVLFSCSEVQKVADFPDHCGEEVTALRERDRSIVCKVTLFVLGGGL